MIVLNATSVAKFTQNIFPQTPKPSANVLDPGYACPPCYAPVLDAPCAPLRPFYTAPLAIIIIFQSYSIASRYRSRRPSTEVACKKRFKNALYVTFFRRLLLRFGAVITVQFAFFPRRDEVECGFYDFSTRFWCILSNKMHFIASEFRNLHY